MYGFKCEYCDGTVEEVLTTEEFWRKGELYVLIDAPIGICNRCHNRYYSAQILEKVETLVRDRSRYSTITATVASFASVE
jgi:YgiT-type zinc finger domain-containing protein